MLLNDYIILIIEDNDDFRENLAECLLLEGYLNVLQARTGKHGIELTLKFIPDLVICDTLMTDGNGYEVLEVIVSTEKTHGIPFIFSTSKSDRKELRAALSLGADDILVKPYENDLLLDTISNLLKSGSKRK